MDELLAIGPIERVRRGVPVLDVVEKGSGQVLAVFVCAPPQSLAAEDGEPALHLVEPGGVGGRADQTISSATLSVGAADEKLHATA